MHKKETITFECFLNNFAQCLITSVMNIATLTFTFVLCVFFKQRFFFSHSLNHIKFKIRRSSSSSSSLHEVNIFSDIAMGIHHVCVKHVNNKCVNKC